MKYKYKLGFIGTGNMTKAIVNGIVKSNILEKNQIILSKEHISEPFMGIKTTTDNNEVIFNSEYLILAVKPQIFNIIKDSLKNTNARVIVSIMAGITIDKLKQSFNKNTTIIRAMPNMPCAINEGMVGIANNNASKEDNDFINSIFNSVAKTCFIDEKLFDTLTSISGSGPAYVYYFINAMIESGVKNGLTYNDSKLLTLQTFKGACAMIENSDEDITKLIDKVCSKGGTTIQAIEHFNKSNINKNIIDGIEMCRKRSEELSK